MPTRPRQHRPPGLPARRPDDRPSSSARGYGWKWRRYAADYLRRHPLCAQCERDGRSEPACHVDHVTPVSGPDDALFWDPDNHQPLCAPCHGRKTALHDGGFGRRPR